MKKSLAAPLLVAMLAIPAGALAQSDAERIADLEKRVESLVKKDKARTADEEKAKAAKGTTLRASTDKGKLEWTSADGANSFRLVGRIQFDGAFFNGSDNRLPNGFTLRRVRIGYKARIAKDWVSELDVDFAENAVDIKDAFIGYEGIKGSVVQAGHFKVPFGMDTLTSSKDLWFVERSYSDAWTPDRRLGFAYQIAGDRYQAKADLFAQTISVDATGVDQGWGWAARGTFAPVMVSETRAIHVGAAMNMRKPDAATSGSGTPPPIAYQIDFSSRPECTKESKAKFLATPTMNQVDWVQQYGGEFAGVWDAFAWQAEYQKTSVTRRSGNPTLLDHDFDTWYGQVSWVIAGGKRKYEAADGLVGRVTPSGKLGAVELLARYSSMDLNDLTATDAIKGGSAKNMTFGANWYPNSNFRVMLDWTRVDNDQYAKPKAAYGGIAGDDFDEFSSSASSSPSKEAGRAIAGKPSGASRAVAFAPSPQPPGGSPPGVYLESNMSSAAPVIIPRWEYRTFGESFGEAEANIRSHGEAKARSSAETYIVSFDSPNNTKIRDGLMDIKKLENVNADTLEQWNPVLKSGFPLTRDVLAQVCTAWGVTLPASAREAWTLEEFLGEVVAPHGRLRAVAVGKERFGLTVDGCIVELANLTFDGKPIRTAAVEHEDPALVIATVRKLGLDRFENTNYIKALKRFAAAAAV